MYGGRFRIGLPEGVVEDLQRQRTPVAGREHVPDEVGQVEGAFAGEQSVMPAPRQHVHGQCGCIGELKEEDLLPRNLRDGRRIVAAGEHVETVEAESHGRVIGEFDDAPRTAVVVDEPSPRQCLERDPESVFGGKVPDPAELVGGHRVVVDGGRRDVAAHQNGEPAGECPDLLRRLLGGDQVGFEDLHTVEAGRRAGVQLLDE